MKRNIGGRANGSPKKHRATSVGLLFGMIVGVMAGMVGLAGPAAATVPGVTLEVSCDSNTGTWTAKSTVSGDRNNPNETATIKNQTLATSEVNGSGGPNSLVGKSVKNTGSVTGYSYGLASNTTFIQKVGVQWTNHKTGDLVYNQASAKTGGSCSKKVPIPAQPAMQDPCGPNNASWVVQNDTADLDWDFPTSGSLAGHAIVRTKNGAVFTDGSSVKDYGVAKDSNTACPVVTVPSVPVVDACGPNNAAFGPVPPGNYTFVVNADGSITFTANKGYTFPNGSTTASLPRPTDSNTPCPPTQVTVTAPKSADKCGPKSNPTKFDRFYIPSQAGVGFTWKGKVVSPGWHKTNGARRVVLTAFATDPATTALTGQTVWQFKYNKKVCHKPDHPGHGGVLRQQMVHKAAGASSPFARPERQLQ